MDFFTDVVALSRFQFAFTVIYHFLFVPLSIGLGLIMALAETRYYKTGNPKDRAATKMWLKIFTATFAVGVATGITMEFAFGANWAEYSRFMGDIFGAPLAAEALFAFFLESVFLGVLIFGRERVSRKFYMVSAWLVWFGSCLSALWILIANSWMQTPAGYEIVDSAYGKKAVLTDFFAAAFNPSTAARYLHTVDALLILGAFVALAISGYYLYKGRDEHFAKSTVRIATLVAIVTTIIMLPSAHYQAVVVAEHQPMKLAAMEGQYEDGPAALWLFGYVDTQAKEVKGLGFEGGTSYLIAQDFNHSVKGLDAFPEEDVAELPVNFVFQAYHLMVAMYAPIVLIVILAAWASFKRLKMNEKANLPKWVSMLFMISPIFPFIAIQMGWATAEVGRQPWIVQDILKVKDAISFSLSAGEILITIAIFFVLYLIVFITWLRAVLGYIKTGPVVEDETADSKGGE